MSKTNHRIHRDREEKLGEPEAHKKRRGFKQHISHVIECIDPYDDSVYDILEKDEYEPVEKIRRRR